MFAPVAPINILEHLQEADLLGTYHLVLAHDVLNHKEEFRNVFKHPALSYATVIVDNSVIELGHPIKHEQIWQAGKIFREVAPKAEVIIVLPDELLNCGKTYLLAKQALKEWKRAPDIGVKFMYVPQGNTFQEFILCAEMMQDFDDITHIGVARNITTICGSRIQAVQMMQAIFPKKWIHLLGFSDNLVDDIMAHNLGGVLGIDSAVPLRLWEHNMRLSDGPYPKRDPDWWDTAPMSAQVYNNVKRVRQWFEGHIK